MNFDESKAFLQDPDFIKKLGTAPKPVQIGTLILISIAVIVAGIWFMAKPKAEELEVLERQETELKQTFDSKQRKAANLLAYEEQLEEMRRSFGTMLRQLPDKTEVESLLVDLSQTSASNSLQVDTFKPTGEIVKEFYAEYPISMEVKGKYHEMARFVSDVAALPRIVTLHDVKIQPAKEAQSNAGSNSSSNELVMNMTAKTYRYLDETE